MKTQTSFLKVVFICLALFCATRISKSQTWEWSENFENGWGGWSATNGVWNIAAPTVGPDTLINGSKLAGTNLQGNYPPNTNTILVSPYIELPDAEPDDRIYFSFWHWFNIDETHSTGSDKGYVQIKPKSSEWKYLSKSTPISGDSQVWTRVCLDITEFKNSSIELGFYFISNSFTENVGWYIDSVEILKKKEEKNFWRTDFEEIAYEWTSDNGLWQIGNSHIPPGGPYSGNNCAGTILKGDYPPNANTRLITPWIELIPKENEIPTLFFYHWFDIDKTHPSGSDHGFIQITEDDSVWEKLGDSIEGTSVEWTRGKRTLSDYSNKKVRIGFYFESNSYVNGKGWYIDDIRIEGIVTSSVDLIAPKPLEFFLQQNYPNPFNPITTIEYSILKSTPVEINIFNQRGQIVRALLNESQVQPGTYSINWDGREDKGQLMTSGIYLYQIRTRNFVSTKKAVLLK